MQETARADMAPPRLMMIAHDDLGAQLLAYVPVEKSRGVRQGHEKES
jgi:hypothetical protein